jgi:hypothetical protein
MRVFARNGTADLLARTGSEHPFTGPEPDCGISIGVAKRVVRDWMNINHKKKNNGNPPLDTNRQRNLYQDPLPEDQRIC